MSGTAAVVGIGMNNRPLLPYFASRGIRVVVADRRPAGELEAVVQELALPETPEVLGGPGYLDRLAERDDIDTVYLTPGMVKDQPAIHRLRERGVRITCETDLFLAVCPAPVIGITGSAGKTTTTTLVAEALKQDGRRPVFVGGNIGHPLLPDLDRMAPDALVVMELSSFQLELVDRSPHGAAILNLSPNHLDVHGTFAAYAAAKARIVRFQSPFDWAVVPADDPQVDALLAGHAGRRIVFGGRDRAGAGVFLAHGAVVWRDGAREQDVIRQDAIRLPGRHNVANAMAATAVVASAGGDLQALAAVLATFQGVPHRLETVREVGGVLYINDSIATAPERTMAALEAVDRPTVLLAGGYDKHLDYDELGKAIGHSRVRLVVVLGQTAEKIASAVRRYSSIPVVAEPGFDAAVLRAVGEARAGEAVLLSPASASYDMFINFEARGQRFREIVHGL